MTMHLLIRAARNLQAAHHAASVISVADDAMYNFAGHVKTTETVPDQLPVLTCV